MAKNNNLTDFLKDLADGIRSKKGTSVAINPQDFRSEIESIETGTDTSDATATADKVFLDETFYAGGQKRTGTFTIASEVNSQNSLIASIKTALEGKTAGSGGDTLKTLLDATKTTKNLFAESTITTAEGLIPYSATENVTSMYQMFSQSKLLTTVPLFDTSKVTNMQNMFYFCYALTTVPLFNTRNVTNMRNMFYQCNALTTIPLFDTSNVTDMQGMFYTCNKLTTAPLFDTSKVTNMQNMFYSCYALTSVSLFDTSKVTNMQAAIYNCKSLKKVVLGKISSKVTNTSNWFNNCTSLEVIHFKGATGVPTLSGISAFNRVPSTCKVVIPDALYDTWTKATNWSAINVTWVKQSEYTEE